MKKLLVLVCIAAVVGCNTGKKETVDFAELLKVKESIEKGSGNAIRRYEEIIDSSLLTGIEVDPKFIALKNQALADLNDLITQALEKGVDKDALLDCIRNNGADSPVCEQYVQPVWSNTSPRLKQFDTDLGKFIANHLDKNSHLPKAAGNCSAIHMGVFQLVIEGDTMLISREKDSQIEQFRGEARKEKVTWINDCTYHLQLVQAESDTTRQLAGPIGFLDDSFIEIIKVTDDYYLYKIFDSANDQEGELMDIGKAFVKK